MARRLAAENQVNVAEIWSYHTIGDQTRFTMVHRAPTPEPRRTPVAKPARAAAPRRAAKSAARKAPPRAVRKTATKKSGSAPRTAKRK
jgi:hypothetical protein